MEDLFETGRRRRRNRRRISGIGNTNLPPFGTPYPRLEDGSFDDDGFNDDGNPIQGAQQLPLINNLYVGGNRRRRNNRNRRRNRFSNRSLRSGRYWYLF